MGCNNSCIEEHGNNNGRDGLYNDNKGTNRYRSYPILTDGCYTPPFSISSSKYKYLQCHDFNQLNNELNAGDLIFFSGRTWSSVLIKYACWSKWSHVGMVDTMEREYRDDRGRLMKIKQCYVWESVREVDQCTDILSEFKKSGVRLVLLENVIRTYMQYQQIDEANEIALPNKKKNRKTVPRCKIGVLRLNFDSGDPARNIFKQKLSELEQQEAGKRYESSLGTLVKSQFGCIFGYNDDDYREFYCSELVLYTYKRLGLLPPYINTSTQTPSYIINHFDKFNDILIGCSLGPVFHEIDLDCESIDDAYV